MKNVDTCVLAVIQVWLGSAGELQPAFYDWSVSLVFKACGALLFWCVCALLIGQLEIGDSLSLISSVKGFGMLFRWNFLPCLLLNFVKLLF